MPPRAPPRNSSMGSNSYARYLNCRLAWHAGCSTGHHERMCGMRNTTILIFAMAALVGPLSTSARAQDKAGYFILGGGFVMPNAEVRDHLGVGWPFPIGGAKKSHP